MTPSIATGLHCLVLLAVYGFLTLRAFLVFQPDWDFLCYHLPAALGYYGLTSYTPSPYYQKVILGFPPLAERVEGLLVLLSGRVSAANSANAVAFFVLIAGLRALFRSSFPLRWFLTSALMIPLVWIHYTSGYVDLWNGCSITLAFFALLKIEGDAKQWSWPNLLLLALATAMAVFAKFQAWPICGLITGYAFCRVVYFVSTNQLPAGKCALFITLLGAIMFYWPLRNFIRFRNPTYPVVVPVLSGLFQNGYPLHDGILRENMPRYLWGRSPALRFVHSALELNRWKTSEPMTWTIDQASSVRQSDSPHWRMGGWFLVSVVVLVSLFGFGMVVHAFNRRIALLFLSSILVVAFLPLSHDLRYWLYIPLSLGVFACLTFPKLQARHRRLPYIARFAILICALYVGMRSAPIRAFDTRNPSEFAPTEARQFWASVTPSDRLRHFRICGKAPDTIFWAGNNFNALRIDACSGMSR